MNLNKELSEQGVEFNQLPIDIQNYILSFLDAKSLSFFGTTDKANFKKVIHLLRAWGRELLDIKLTTSNFTTFLYTPDELHACGANVYWNLGLGALQKNVTTFKSVRNLKGTIREVFTNGNTTFVLTTAGLFGCGRNGYSQLGIGNTLHQATFQKIPHIEGKIQKVALGDSHTLVLTDNELYGCGSNESGQLGFDDRKVLTHFKPIAVPGKIKKVVVGDSSSFVVTDEGLFVSGKNDDGQLGLGHKKTYLKFTEVKNIPKKVMDVVTYAGRTFLITDEGLFACGVNKTGRLGFRDGNDRTTFTRIDQIKGKVKQVLIQADATVILTDLKVHCFGKYFFEREFPLDLEEGYEAISNGYSHLLISNRNSLLAYGQSIFGEFGLGKEVTLPQFKNIKYLFPGNIQQVRAGERSTLVYTDKGIYGCGSNCNGQLGLGNIEVAEKVTKIDLPRSIQQRFEFYGLLQSFLKKAEMLESNKLNINDSHEVSKKEIGYQWLKRSTRCPY